MELKLSKQSVWKIIKDYAYLIMGAFCPSAATYFFMLPSKIVAGGVGGLSNILFYWFGWKVSIVSIILQVPLLIMALIMLPKSFSVKTVFSCIVYSGWAYLFERFFPSVPNTMPSSRILWLLVGAVVDATGIYLAYAAGGSNGGSEIVSSIVVKKNPDAKIGNVLVIFNYVVYALALVCFITTDGINMESMIRILYSVLMSYAVSFVVDLLSNGIYPLLKYYIITTKDEEIAQALYKTFKRGVSKVDLVDGEGNQLKDKKMLVVVIQYRQNTKLKHLVKHIDPECFAYCKTIDNVVTRPDFKKRYK